MCLFETNTIATAIRMLQLTTNTRNLHCVTHARFQIADSDSDSRECSLNLAVQRACASKSLILPVFAKMRRLSPRQHPFSLSLSVYHSTIAQTHKHSRRDTLSFPFPLPLLTLMGCLQILTMLCVLC